MWVESVRKCCPISADLEFCTGALGESALSKRLGTKGERSPAPNKTTIALSDFDKGAIAKERLMLGVISEPNLRQGRDRLLFSVLQPDFQRC